MYTSSILSAAHKELCCSICVDLLDAPVMMPCGHCFCSRCATRSLEHLSRCPLCKADVSARSVMDLPLLARVAALSRDIAAEHGVEDLAFASQWSHPTPVVGRSPALNATAATEDVVVAPFSDMFPPAMRLPSSNAAAMGRQHAPTIDGDVGPTTPSSNAARTWLGDTQVVEGGAPMASSWCTGGDSMTPWRRWCTPSSRTRADGVLCASDNIPPSAENGVDVARGGVHDDGDGVVAAAAAGGATQNMYMKASSSDDQRVLLLSDGAMVETSSPAARSTTTAIDAPSRWLPRRPSGSGTTPRVTPPPIPVVRQLVPPPPQREGDASMSDSLTASNDVIDSESTSSGPKATLLGDCKHTTATCGHSGAGVGVPGAMPFKSSSSAAGSTPPSSAADDPPHAACCLCHLSVGDRRSVGDFLATVLRQDSSCDAAAIRAMDEAMLTSLLGTLCGPFPRPQPSTVSAIKRRHRDDNKDKEEDNVFAHYACLLWSPEVYLDPLGAMVNVDKALRRGPRLRCAFCKRPGATLGCSTKQCRKSFHIPCALLCGAAVCTVDPERFTLQCVQHAVSGHGH